MSPGSYAKAEQLRSPLEKNREADGEAGHVEAGTRPGATASRRAREVERRNAGEERKDAELLAPAAEQ